MMKYQSLMFGAFLVLLASCSQSTRNTDQSATTDSLKSDSSVTPVSKGLYAKMTVAPSINIGQPVEMTFTVYNDADTAQQFCKWHTPFEPLLSKYLDITDDKGEEVMYKGAMAKRIMPPPADSYIKIQPKDSLSVKVDLLKGYDIVKPATYKVKYNAQNMSGLTVTDSITFSYRK